MRNCRKIAPSVPPWPCAGRFRRGARDRDLHEREDADPSDQQEMPAMDASTIVQFAMITSTSFAHTHDLLADVLTRKSVMPRWARA